MSIAPTRSIADLSRKDFDVSNAALDRGEDRLYGRDVAPLGPPAGTGLTNIQTFKNG